MVAQSLPNCLRVVAKALFTLILLASMASPAGAGGLFVSDAELDRIRGELPNLSGDLLSSYNAQRSKADSALSAVADPFEMNDLSQITFHWCSPDKDGIDNSMWDAQRQFEADSARIRALALEFALTGDSRYADKSLEMMRVWAQRHTPVNVFDYSPNFQDATLAGMTSGFCSDRPWNFALDVMWQTYGLINVSDAWILLRDNGYTISAADGTLLRDWVLEVAEAVNSSFQTWTRWADLHTTSGSFERYRSDNHLSWCLAGLLAASVALEDDALSLYVLEGGSWTDRRAGSYANPSHIRDVIDRAIESSGDASGRIYEERIMRDPPVGYALFHLWAMSLVTRIAQVHYGLDLWSHQSADGSRLKLAYDRYADVILGRRSSPDPNETTFSNHAWLYELAYGRWRDGDYWQIVDEHASPSRQIQQSAGPTTLLFRYRAPAAPGDEMPAPYLLP